MSGTFEAGKAYWANPCPRDMGERKIVIVTKREGERLELAMVDDLVVGRIDGSELSGEFVKISGRDNDFVVSSQMSVPLDVSTEILRLMRDRSRA